MRIDYNEPKQAYVTAQNAKQPRKEPVGMITTIVIFIGVITFIIGFGAGWFFSQRSAKKAFQAATEQISLENSPRQEVTSPAKVQPPQQTSATSQQQPDTSNTQIVPGSAQATPEPPLSFYKTLPGSQKNNVMGSGINTRDDKAKQPLQAAIPSNLIKPQPPGTDTPKPIAAMPQTVPDKHATKQDSSSFTVQVASYSQRLEAETLKNKLTSKGYNVTIIEFNQGVKGTWYRVRVGKKLDQEAAKELAAQLGKGAIAIPERD